MPVAGESMDGRPADDSNERVSGRAIEATEPRSPSDERRRRGKRTNERRPSDCLEKSAEERSVRRSHVMAICACVCTSYLLNYKKAVRRTHPMMGRDDPAEIERARM